MKTLLESLKCKMNTKGEGSSQGTHTKSLQPAFLPRAQRDDEKPSRSPGFWLGVTTSPMLEFLRLTISRH
ncbi:hypothetical protein E5D57_000609 [Metarhizium anisopliae]|nr:hypothetical protein E5D57_000609 [Metarhizium anisopliae]